MAKLMENFIGQSSVKFASQQTAMPLFLFARSAAGVLRTRLHENFSLQTQTWKFACESFIANTR